MKSADGPPIELSSKFTPDSSVGGFDAKDKGVITMTRINNNGVKKSQAETSILSVQNI